MKLAFIWFLSSTKESNSYAFIRVQMHTTAEVKPILQQETSNGLY